MRGSEARRAAGWRRAGVEGAACSCARGRVAGDRTLGERPVVGVAVDEDSGVGRLQGVLAMLEHADGQPRASVFADELALGEGAAREEAAADHLPGERVDGLAGRVRGQGGGSSEAIRSGRDAARAFEGHRRSQTALRSGREAPRARSSLAQLTSSTRAMKQ